MTATHKPTVSIIMATFNRGNIIRHSIEHIFQQDYTALELIIINDGSTDNTLEILKEFQRTNQIILIDNAQNLGIQASLNKGIKRASGKYIARIDDHDKWIQKDKLSKQVSFLEANPEIGVLGTAFRIENKIIQNRLTDRLIRKQMLFRSPFCHVTILMKKSIIDQVGGYDESLSYSEDWDLWLKAGNHTQLANLEDVTTEVIEESNSLTNDFVLKQFPINRQIISAHLKNYPNGKLAVYYHWFIHLFFKSVPYDGIFHRLMKRIFNTTFLSS